MKQYKVFIQSLTLCSITDDKFLKASLLLLSNLAFHVVFMSKTVMFIMMSGKAENNDRIQCHDSIKFKKQGNRNIVYC